MNLNNFETITLMVTTPIGHDYSTITDFTAQTSQGRLLISTEDNREISLPAEGWVDFLDDNMTQLIDGGIKVCIEGI